MSQNGSTHGTLTEILNKHEPMILSDWIKEQSSVQGRRGAAPKESELRTQSRSSSDCSGRA